MIRRALLMLVLCLLPTLAHAQSKPVFQSGTMSPGDLAKFFTNGLIGDAKGISGDIAGKGVNPFAITDVNAMGLCSDTAPTTGAYRAFCLGHDTSGNALLTVDSYGGASAQSLLCRVNGVTAPCLSSIAGVPIVADNGSLQALAAAAYGKVIRSGYSAAGDGGYGVYTWSGSPCSLSAGAGDNGSQVAPNAGTGCWLLDYSDTRVVPQVFGAKGDASTNDRPALQAWINFGQSNFPSAYLWLPTTSGYYNLTDGTSLLVSKSVYIDGPGLALDTLAQQFTCPAGTPTLHWASNTAAPVLRVSSATSHNTLYGGSLKGFCADGNYKATIGVQLSSTQQWVVDVAEVKMTVGGLQIDDCNGNGAVGGAGLSMGNHIPRNYYNFGTAGLGADSSDAVRLDASCTTTGVTNTQLGLLVSSIRNGDGFVNKGGDADQVEWVFPFRDPGGTGNGIAFRCVSPGNTCGRTTQIVMGQGQVLAEAGSYGNNIAFLHSEGSGVTLQGTPGVNQAQLQYHTVDNGSGAWFKAHDDYLIYDELTIPASAWTGAQFPGGGTQAATVTDDTVQFFGKAVKFPASVNSAAVAGSIAPIKWAAGQITGLKIYGYYVGNCSGTDKFQIDANSADYRLGTAVLGNDATGFPQTFTPTTSGQANAGMLVTVAFGTTLPTAAFSGMQFRITRQTGGTCQATDFYMTGVSLVFAAGGPSVNAVGPWQVAAPPWHAP